MVHDQVLAAAASQQNIAADSAHSVWVSASAGTGKTYVLTKRILQLLLKDLMLIPQQILAVTFTRAAAREMENRLLSKVSAWQALDDAALDSDMATIIDGQPTEAQRTRARGLFPLMLAKSVQINTLHGFCQHILARFPLEAGLQPHFQLCDDHEALDLLEAARVSVYRDALAGKLAPDWVFPELASHVSEGKMTDLLKQFVMNAAKFKKLKQTHHTVTVAAAVVAERLNVPADTAVLDGMAAKCAEMQATCRSAIAALGDHDGKRVQAMLAPLKAALSSEMLCDYLSALTAPLGADGSPYAKGWLLGEKATADQRDSYDVLAQSCARLLTYYHSLKTARLTAAYLHLGFAVLDRYEQLKTDQALVDFDDLITLTEKLMATDKEWLHYKLDSGIRHVLLDEAQDTDFAQWQILKNVIDEFYAGVGQFDTPRTFFAVGDVKQSIYRFRGAEPGVFDAMRAYLNSTTAAVATAEMRHSFRSTTPILEAVDHVFAGATQAKAVSGSPDALHHQAVQQGSGGAVVLWPAVAVEAEKPAPREPWTLPQQTSQQPTARRLVAAQIATEIKTLMNSREILHTTKRPVQPSDVMILVRARTMLPDIIAALDHAGLPHTGADTVALLDDPNVLDVIALMKWRLCPADKLSYYRVLKSPLVGWDDAALMADAAPPVALLISPHLSAYGFLTAALDRLPVQRSEGITYLLERALEMTARGSGDLTTFIHDLSDILFKKELAQHDGGIRIMTAHSAKGLEAPVVFLADSGRYFYQNIAKEAVLWGEDTCLMRLTKAESTPYQQHLEEAEKQRLFDDEMRLLYVAMTRAKDRLYIAAEAYKEDHQNHCWHGIIAQAVSDIWPQDSAGNAVWQRPVTAAPLAPTAAPLSPVEQELPTWCTTPAPAEKGLITRRPTDKAQTVKALVDPAQMARTSYGDAMHRLLEVLPTYDAAQRHDKGTRYLHQQGYDTTQAAAMVARACEMIVAYPEFFGANSRAEVPVMALSATEKLDGVIDRLVVTPEEVRIIDYKTGTPAPEAYRSQLMAYVRMMHQIYPDRTVRAGILWLKTGKCQWLF